VFGTGLLQEIPVEFRGYPVQVQRPAVLGNPADQSFAETAVQCPDDA